MEAVDFGYLFSRFCHFYRMTDDQVLAMPVRRFWLMNANINRIQAEGDLRQLVLLTTAQAADGDVREKQRQALVAEMGNVMVMNRREELDRSGLELLRAMSKGLM
ncbi:hypothetical protein [Ectothiorhodospira shaposhnikovii]|uniref:hypothetical protein n=1 Tax=Ectothiorhodospira shaposhnikovii TaxID=1054 RepID=UPI001EE958D8|nr:hypothetical protein [Ectothiorhodospira shaposhnikovii]MCG5512861.1 hypothetical protein [Ectothiorhodospira shaposhnikovii]